MFHRDATMNQGQGDVSPLRVFFFFLKYGLIRARSKVKQHMRRTKLQFESTQTGRAQFRSTNTIYPSASDGRTRLSQTSN